jgi:hypothetical protein
MNHLLRWTLAAAVLGLVITSVASAAVRFARSADLTPGGGVSDDSPAIAVGVDGRVVAAYSARTELFVRSGTTRGSYGRAQRLGVRFIPAVGGGKVATAVGPDGEAAVAWGAAGPPHNTRVLVSVAPPHGRFGRARWIDGRDTAFSIDGVGIDRGGRVVVSWNDLGSGCCERGTVRYAIGSPSGVFTPPATLPLEHQAGGLGQVLETATGGVVVTGESTPFQLFELAATAATLNPLPTPPGDGNGEVDSASAGPGGIGGAIYSVDPPNMLAADVAATRLDSTTGMWTTPIFAPLTGRVPTAGPSPDTQVALPASGDTVLQITVGRRLELAIAPPGGSFAAPRVIGPAPSFIGETGVGAPALSAFGPDVALVWLTGPDAHQVLQALIQPAGGGTPVTRSLGRVDDVAYPALATGGTHAVIVWEADHHVLVAAARAGPSAYADRRSYPGVISSLGLKRARPGRRARYRRQPHARSLLS